MSIRQQSVYGTPKGNPLTNSYALGQYHPTLPELSDSTILTSNALCSDFLHAVLSSKLQTTDKQFMIFNRAALATRL